jgi:hypothetical protein
MIRFGRDSSDGGEHGWKGIAVKKYVVRLGAEEREQLQALIGKGKSPAKRLLKARILLKADISEAGEGWSDTLPPQPEDASASSSADTASTAAATGLCGNQPLGWSRRHRR